MLADFMESFVLLEKSTTPSSISGVVESWEDGNTISAGVYLNNSSEAQIAYRNGEVKQYYVVLPAGITLTQNDRIRRVSDGAVYRITSDSADMTIPSCASQQYSRVTAEIVDHKQPAPRTVSV